MRRYFPGNGVGSCRKWAKYKKFGIIAALGISMAVTACGRQEPVDNSIKTSFVHIEEETEDPAEPLPMEESIREKMLADLQDDPPDMNLIEVVQETVILGSDTEIEACEWVDEEKSCLRIRVQYKEQPPDNYQHKEDYFFFLEGEDIQALYVDYPTKDSDNIREDRYVWDACDFEAHLEDVTFDGQRDLIIFLGHSGSHGIPVHGAYVYEDGFYHYKSSFEDIPDYEVDAEAQIIRGFSVDSAMYEEDYIFKYRDGDFVKVSYHLHEIGFAGY